MYFSKLLKVFVWIGHHAKGGLRAQRINFRKKIQTAFDPPALVSENYVAFYLDIRNQITVNNGKNLQHNFLDRKLPPPLFEIFRKFI